MHAHNTNNQQKQNIKSKLANLLFTFLDKENVNVENETLNDLLQIVVSHSIQAINFIILVEDEFNCELNDDEIGLEIFTNVDRFVDLINESVAAKEL